MALTPEKLNDVERDVDDITKFATSLEHTLTDRLGNTKPTMQGLIDELNADANVTEVIEARDEVRDLHAEITALALQVEASAHVYTTLAAALADGTLTAGTNFQVKAASGASAYLYTRTATGAQYLSVNLFGPDAPDLTYSRNIMRTLTPVPPGLTAHVWASLGLEYDGRAVPNELSPVKPTLNHIPDPWDALDELGTTPTREPNTAAVLDPLGGTSAMKITATAQNQTLSFNQNYGPVAAAFDLRLRAWVQSISGTNIWRLTTTAAGADNVGAPVGAWPANPVEITVVGYTNANGIPAFGSGTGNANGVAAVAGFQAFDPLAGESASLPGLQASLDAQKAGHLKAAWAAIGSITFTSTRNLSLDPANRGAYTIHFDPNPPAAFNSYSWGGIMECTALAATTYCEFFGTDFHTIAGGAVGPTHGQLALYGTGANPADPQLRTGRFYANPGLSVLINLQDVNMQGGKHSVLGTVNNGDTMYYVDGIPIYVGVVGTWTAPRISRWLVGAYNGTSERHKVANPMKGSADGLAIAHSKVLNQEEVLQLDRCWRERLRLQNDSMAPRKALMIGCHDSTTAFSPSYYHHLGDYQPANPRFALHMDAVGGTNIDNWIAEPRFQQLKNRIYAAYKAGWDRALILCRPGTNELAGTRPWSWINNGYSWTIWQRDWYTAIWVNGLLTIPGVPPEFVEFVHITLSPRVSVGDEYLTEDMRQRWNDYMRVPANQATVYMNRKVYLVDMGLGTERITDLLGNTVPETIPGGRIMANWRFANAARTYNRAIAPALTLSLLNDAAIAVNTSPATPGTFTKLDMWKKLVIAGSAGYGRIEAVTADGSGCTVNTLDEVVGTPYPGEFPQVASRDKIARGGGYASLTPAAGTASVQNNSEKWQTDGIHQTSPGGREECDYAAPTLQGINDRLVGSAFGPDA